MKDIERKPGSGPKVKMAHEDILEPVTAALSKWMHAHAKDLGTSEKTVRRAVKELSRKSLVMLERPLLTLALSKRPISNVAKLF